MLTSAQDSSLRRALGYPAAGLDPYDVLPGVVAQLTAEGEAALVSLITQWDAAQTAIVDASGRAGFKRIEDIEWYRGGVLGELRGRASEIAAQMATMLGLTLRTTAPARTGHTLRG